MEDYIGKLLDAQFASRNITEKSDHKTRNKSVIALALEGYEQENNAGSAGMDTEFRNQAIAQMKTFLFAGHDTSSSTIAYAYHLLSLNAEALHKIRQEHDDVLGTDVSKAPLQLKKDPHLLTKMKYTLAVIKEVLRIYPAASSTRKGEKGFYIDYDGKQYPTENFMMWSVSHAIHHRGDLWPDAESFIPERFLVEEGDPLFPVKGAWRPFEYGPRNCIGQELAMIEIKLVLALTLRSFDIEAAFDEWDKLHGKPSKGPKTVNGDRAYQVLYATAKPADGMPVRIKKRPAVA